MSKKTLSLLIFLFPILLTAQNWKVDFGKTYKKERRTGIIAYENRTKFIGLDENSYFMTYTSKKERQILQFDFKNDLINTIPIGKTQDDKKLVPEIILKSLHGKYLISSHYKKRKRETSIYATLFKSDGRLEKVNKPLLTYKTDQNTYSLGSNHLNRDSKGFNFSPDSSKVVFTSVTSKSNNNRNKKYYVWVFDQNLEKIWEKEVILPYEDEKIKVIQFGVTNNGEVFLMTQVNNKKYSIIPRDDYILLRIKPREKKYKINFLSLKGLPIISTMVFSENDDLFVAGFYTKGIKKTISADGIFIKRFRYDDELLLSKKHPFKDEIKQYLIPNRRKRGELKSYKFYIDDLLIDYRNRKFVFVAENRYSNISEGIIMSRLSFDGDLDWIFHKPKKFVGISFGNKAYGLSHSNGNIF